MNSEALDALLHQENMIPAIQWLGEQIPGGFFIYRADESQEILFANQAVLRIFGCKDMNEFIMLTGNTFRGMVHPDDVKAIQASIDQQIANSNNDNLDYVEYRILRKDGSVRWEMTTVILHNFQDMAMFTMSSLEILLTNISFRKRITAVLMYIREC